MVLDYDYTVFCIIIDKRYHYILKKINYILKFYIFLSLINGQHFVTLRIFLSVCPQMSERQMCESEPFLHLSTHVFDFLACSLVPSRHNSLFFFLSFFNPLVISFHLWSYFRTKNDSASVSSPCLSPWSNRRECVRGAIKWF